MPDDGTKSIEGLLSGKFIKPQLADPPPMPKPGEQFAGRYTVERRVGRGGMGEVFLARQAPLDRLVALKILPEWALMARGLSLFGRRDLLLYLLGLPAFHTSYVLLVGLAGLTGKSAWKGRSHQMQRKP